MDIKLSKGELDIRYTYRDNSGSMRIDEINKSRTSINF